MDLVEHYPIFLFLVICDPCKFAKFSDFNFSRNIGNNDFSGSVPAFSGCNLIEISLDGNQLVGDLNFVNSLDKLQILYEISKNLELISFRRVGGNLFSGTFPKQIGLMTGLTI